VQAIGAEIDDAMRWPIEQRRPVDLDELLAGWR